MKQLQELLGCAVEIPAGIFLMGARPEDPDAGPYESPQHEVYLDTFRMASTTVTNDQFAKFVTDTRYVTLAERVRLDRTWQSFAEEKGDHPVVCVSHGDVMAYLEWLNTTHDLQGFNGFRLPTEAEWEKAARGGLEQSLFPWGDQLPQKGERMAWARSSADQTEDLRTMPVGSFESNGYGLFDMACNVWQWCSDWYADGYYAACAAQGCVANPTGPEKGLHKVRRGASWNIGEPFRARCSNRGCLYPEQVEENVGFRWVLS